MEAISQHLLSWVIFLPLAGVVPLLLLPKRTDKGAKVVAAVVLLLDFVLSLKLLAGFNSAGGFQFVENYSWVERFGIHYSIAIDGISLWLVLLSTFLGPILVISTWNAVTDRVREYMVAMLVLQTAMIGTFCALDMVLFYVFWEAMLIPMALIIGVWGGQRRVYASVKFFLYTMAGSMLMLAAILYMYSKGAGNFSWYSFRSLPLSGTEQAWLFGAFTLAFAIKVPIFPLHTWLPDAHVEAPTAGSVVLAGVLLKMGTYGLLRFAIPYFPEAVQAYAPLLSTLAVIGIVYGALVAMVQPDVKKLVAYSSVSHLGFVVLGLFALTPESIAGAIYIMLGHGLATGSLFLLVGFVYERRHTRRIADFGGLAQVMPLYATAFMIATLASIGLPGLSGFVGEFLVLLGSFKSPSLHWAMGFTVIAATGVILGALYMLWMYQRVFLGRCENPDNKGLKDLSLREVLLLVPLFAFILWMGLQPGIWLSRMESDIDAVIQHQSDSVAAAAQQHQSQWAAGDELFAPASEGEEVSR
jgi:NADH-quinone oxidoreductase subunit M